MIDKIINPEAENARLLAESAKMVNAMSFLIRNPHFELFRAELQAQYDRRMKQVLQMPESADDVIKRTYVTGEMATFQVVINMPELLLEGAKSEVESAHVYDEHDKEMKEYNNVQDEDFDTD